MRENVRGKKRSDKFNFFKTIFPQAKCLLSYKGGAGGRHHQQLDAQNLTKNWQRLERVVSIRIDTIFENAICCNFFVIFA